MKVIPMIGAVALVVFGLGLTFIPEISQAAATVTTTIIGWNVPSATTLSTGLVAMILPLIVTALFVAFPLYLKVQGNIIVTLALMGFTAGSLFGMLSTSGTAVVSPTSIPFAQTIIGAVLLIVWIWKGAD